MLRTPLYLIRPGVTLFKGRGGIEQHRRGIGGAYPRDGLRCNGDPLQQLALHVGEDLAAVRVWREEYRRLRRIGKPSFNESHTKHIYIYSGCGEKTQ